MKRIVIVVLFLALLASAGYSEEPRLTWKMEGCYTLDDVTVFLNKLPAERALEAKVVAINSQRSFLGTLSTPYYVWHRSNAR